MFERIIRNEVYMGTLVQLKTKTETVGCRQIKNPKEEWVRVENILMEQKQRVQAAEWKHGLRKFLLENEKETV